MGAEGSAGRRMSVDDSMTYAKIGSVNTTEMRRPSWFAGNDLVHPPFHGVWSTLPNTGQKSPGERVGQFSASDSKVCYVGYGARITKDVVFQDLWKLDLRTLEWTEIKLSGYIPSPRNGAKALLYRNTHIIVFGGFFNNDYYSDLFAIDVRTGVVQRIETTGPAPCARSSMIVGIYEGKFFVWGGYNGTATWPTDLHILDIKSRVWSVKQTKVQGRMGAPFVQVGSKLISYGGSQKRDVLIIDMEAETVEAKEATGSLPPSENMGGGMAKIGNYVFYYGGKSSAMETNAYAYALDVERMWWFVFHMLPDMDTVFLQDGHISDTGGFMLPSMHSFACVYSKARKQVLCFMGVPGCENGGFYGFSVGSALGIIHLRDDMKDMLYQ